ncbi:MAG: PQQ-binding-like beta-propeller repeat protein, partial [Ktedonobacterales bacterium]
LGAIRTALSQQTSPSHATLVALSADDSGRMSLSGLSGHDGSLLWRRALGLYQVSGVVADGQVYIAGDILPYSAQPTDTTRPVVMALRLSDGAPLWQEPLPGLQPLSGLLVAGDLLIATVYTSVSPPTFQLVAVNRASHTLAWRVTPTSLPAVYDMHALATGDGMLFLGSQDGVARALRLSDGSPAWSERISPPATAAQPVISLGMVARGDTLIAYDTTGEVVSLRLRDGATRWGRQVITAPFGGPGEHLALTGAGLYLCGVDAVNHERALVLLDPLTGVLRWSRGAACGMSLPIESGGYVYTLDSTLLTALRVSDGALVWRGQPEEADLSYTTLQSDGGVIFAATTIANYRSFSVCGQWFPPGINLCHSTQYVAAFDSATGARYWRTADSYIGLLGAAAPTPSPSPALREREPARAVRSWRLTISADRPAAADSRVARAPAGSCSGADWPLPG